MNYLWIGLGVAAVVLLIGVFLYWKWRLLEADFLAREEKLKNFRVSLRPGSEARFLEMNGRVVKRRGAEVVFKPANAYELIRCKVTNLEPPH